MSAEHRGRPVADRRPRLLSTQLNPSRTPDARRRHATRDGGAGRGRATRDATARPGHPRRDAAARRLTVVAALSYATSVLLGVGLALRLGGERHRWVHHAGYISTVTTTTLAATGPLWSRTRAGAVLLGALPALAALSQVPTRSRRHPVVALSALPCYLAAVLLTRRADVRPENPEERAWS